MATKTTYTLNELYEIFKNKVNEASSNKPTFWGAGGIARAFAKAATYPFSWLQLQLNITQQAFYIKSSKASHLDKRFEDFDFTRKTASAATGIQEFFGEAGRASDVTIPIGTVVETSPDILGNSIAYTTDAELTLLVADSSVTGTVTCSQVGTIGNVQSGNIDVLSSTVPGITGTANVETFTSGQNLETDLQAKERFGQHLIGLQNGNESAILAAVRAVDGVNYARIVENHPVQGNYSIYVSSETGTISSTTRDAIVAALEDVQAFPVTYSIIAPTEYPTTVAFTVKLNTDDYEQAELVALLKSNLRNRVNQSGDSELLRSEVICQVISTAGVLNVYDLTIDGVDADLVKSDLFVIKIDDVTDITITVAP